MSKMVQLEKYIDVSNKKFPYFRALYRAPTTLNSEGEVTSLSAADKREVRDNREKW
jgi:hypothetical protein